MRTLYLIGLWGSAVGASGGWAFVHSSLAAFLAGGLWATVFGEMIRTWRNPR